MGIIYRITNIHNGKVYIGQTVKSAQRRWTQHVSEARKGVRSHLYNAIRRYGKDLFEIQVVDTASSAVELSRLEQDWIAKVSSRNPDIGYNITPGGDGAGAGPDNPNYGKPGLNRGRKFPPEFGIKVSKAKTGLKLSEQARQGVIRGLTGRICSEETRKKHSLRMTGDKNPRFGKHHSDEAKRERSELMKSLVWIYRPNHPAKRIPTTELHGYLARGWIKGRIAPSEETKRRISKTLKGRHTSPATELKPGWRKVRHG